MARYLLLTLALAPLAAAELRFEAEQYSSPSSAWVANTDRADCWNLFSLDNDAAKKWSGGGVVLRSPVAVEDRATPAEGAPPLRVRLTGIPAGSYDLELRSVVRTLGVSLDGERWRPYRGGPLLKALTITTGELELFVDDRYAHPDHPGPAYFDCVVLRPAVPVVNGLVNPGYEALEGAGPAGWTWWSRQGVGSAAAETERHAGERSVRVRHDGAQDWALTANSRIVVTPGARFSLTGWAKLMQPGGVQLAAVGYAGGQVVSWSVGGARSSAVGSWQELVTTVTVPAPVDTLVVRWTGNGPTDACLDEVALTPLP